MYSSRLRTLSWCASSLRGLPYTVIFLNSVRINLIIRPLAVKQNAPTYMHQKGTFIRNAPINCTQECTYVPFKNEMSVSFFREYIKQVFHLILF